MISTFLYSTADFSDDMKYRYLLTREWDSDKPQILFIMLNPSTADAEKMDPTVTRCYNFAHKWGYGRMVVCNIFALRSTNPRELKKIDDPIGEYNDHAIGTAVRSAHMVIAAWGEHGEYMKRGEQVAKLIQGLGRDIYCLKVSKNGNPMHPLYLPGDLEPIVYKKVA
jgi:hypothetical protein